MKEKTFIRDSKGYYYQPSKSTRWLDVAHEQFREQYPEFHRIRSDDKVKELLTILQSPNPSERDRLYLNGFLGCKVVGYSFAERFHIIDKLNRWDDYDPQTTKRKMRWHDRYLASGGKFGSELACDDFSTEFNDCTIADSHHRQLNLTRVAEDITDYVGSTDDLEPSLKDFLRGLALDMMGLVD